MTLDTLFTTTFSPLPANREGMRALVLMGGGARTAYQVGVLKGLARLLQAHGAPPAAFPFQILLGTSAGALNATYLASLATQGLQAFDALTGFWRQLHSHQVYRLRAPAWPWPNLLTSGLTLMRQVRQHRALLDTLPLVDTLHRHVHLDRIDTALQERALTALAVTASSYTSGEHWTFCQTAQDDTTAPWRRPGRRASMQTITIEHLMASSAIPFLFPAVPLWVDGHKEFFGDGSMRQLSPLSPALQLGASDLLVIGAGQAQRAGMTTGPATEDPTAGTIAGHALASVFHDTLQADVEQAQRVSRTLEQLPPEVAQALPYRRLNVLAIQPSISLDELALKHVEALPRATRDTLAGLGALETRRTGRSSGAALASYLLFEPAFINALIDCGERDAMLRQTDLLAFFDMRAS
ncbi:patatin-like phospholipase family protein [Hydrogenophaga aquatica]